MRGATVERLRAWLVPSLVAAIVLIVGGVGYLVLARAVKTPAEQAASGVADGVPSPSSSATAGRDSPGAGLAGPGGWPDGSQGTPGSDDQVAGGTGKDATGGGGPASSDSEGPSGGAAVDCATAQCVALTFDDGPDPHTDAILDVLAAKGVPATFFVQGYRVNLFPDQLRRVVAEGHEVGNHTWNHKYLTKLSPRAIRLQIAKTNKAVQELTGVTPRLVRPPYGAIDAKVREHVDLPLILWTVDTRDWETKSVKRILKHVKRDTEPGAIVLMHDTLAETGKALTRAIEILEQKGYTFVTVSQLLGQRAEAGTVYSRQ
jgi:peptidoglycan/xylan/chitin deacetylase (PgdA/CDA1 family)